MTKQAAPIKLAILTRMFPNIVQTYVLNHILSMKEAGIKTLIVAERDPHQNEIHPRATENGLIEETLYIDTEKDKLRQQLANVPVTSISYLLTVLRILFSRTVFRHGIFYTIKTLARAVLKSAHKTDIIHSHSLFSTYDYLFMKEVFSIPITTTFHGLVPKNVKMLESDKIKAVLDTGDAFFVNTDFALKQLTGLGCPREKIHIIPQGTHVQDFPFVPRCINSDKEIIILSVGRLSIEKGFHIAIESIANLITRFPNIRYHIVGGGIEEDNLKAQIKQSGLEDVVTIFGAISTGSLLEHYTSAHIFVLPSIDFRDGSHTETQGVVLQEAQSSGVPIIASRTGGIPEIIKHCETGLLVDEESVGQLSDSIEMLITDKNLYQALHVKGRKDVEDNYSTEVICKRLTDVYEDILLPVK